MWMIFRYAKSCAAPGNLTAKWDFTYDGDGVRTGQSYTHYTNGTPGTPVITRYFFGGALETQGSTVTKYYSFAGQTIAMKDGTGSKYFLTDHLGSVSVVLSGSGTILEQQRYLPFGGARVMPPYASVTSTDFTYTGQRNLPDTGLMDYDARFYSQSLGRFIQPDSIIPGVANPQSWNRYAYVANNPLRYSDPTGHKPCEDYQGSCLSEKQMTKQYKSNLEKLREKSNNKNKPKGNGGGGGGGHSNGGVDPLKYILNDLYNNPILAGGQSSDGCNTWLLWNGSNFFHHTTYTHQPICIPVSLCSTTEQWKYALSFQYPGQWPGNPVVGGDQERHVVGGDFIPWKWLQDKGAITVEIDGNSIINKTEKTHIFHQGDITRTVSDGWVTTEGHGTNSSFAVAAFNQYGGPIAFEGWDFLMTSFSTVDKLSDGALFNLVNSIP